MGGWTNDQGPATWLRLRGAGKMFSHRALPSLFFQRDVPSSSTELCSLSFSFDAILAAVARYEDVEANHVRHLLASATPEL